MDGTTRLLIVAGAVALVVYFGWPYFKGEMDSIGRQLRGHGGFPSTYGMHLDETEVSPIEDRRGEHGSRGGDLSRLGPRWDEARGGETETSASAPYHDSNGRPYRRWRDCRAGSIWSDRVHCGPWQYGPAPGDERR
jgi:hypothetical protein